MAKTNNLINTRLMNPSMLSAWNLMLSVQSEAKAYETYYNITNHEKYEECAQIKR